MKTHPRMRISLRIVVVSALCLTSGVAAFGARNLLTSRRVASTKAFPATYDSVDVFRRMSDSATRSFTGTLNGPVPRAIGDSGLVLFLRKEDCLSCEDLGRQLREVQHETRDEKIPLILFAAVEDQSAILDYLGRQRIAIAATQNGDVTSAVDGMVNLPTPALAVVTHNGRIVRGVSHPQRLPNLRLHSFAQELVPARTLNGAVSDARVLRK